MISKFSHIKSRNHKRSPRKREKSLGFPLKPLRTRNSRSAICKYLSKFMFLSHLGLRSQEKRNGVRVHFISQQQIPEVTHFLTSEFNRIIFIFNSFIPIQTKKKYKIRNSGNCFLSCSYSSYSYSYHTHVFTGWQFIPDESMSAFADNVTMSHLHQTVLCVLKSPVMISPSLAGISFDNSLIVHTISLLLPFALYTFIMLIVDPSC